EPGLDDAIAAKGWTVERVIAYRLQGRSSMPAAVRKAVVTGEIDVLTFASGGTARAFLKLLKGEAPPPSKGGCIGPLTAQAARAAGLRVTKVARVHTIPGLVASVVDAETPKKKSGSPRRGRAR